MNQTLLISNYCANIARTTICHMATLSLALACLFCFNMPNAKAQTEIVHSHYFGSANSEQSEEISVFVKDGIVHVLSPYNVPESDIRPEPTPAGASTTGMLVYMQFDEATGEPIMSKVISNALSTTVSLLAVDDNYVYVSYAVNGNDFISTDGSASHGGVDVAYMKLDVGTGDILESSYIGGSGLDMPGRLTLENGSIHIGGLTASTDFPVTDGSTGNGFGDVFYMRIDVATSSVAAATYVVPYLNDRIDMFVQNNDVSFILDTSTPIITSTNGSTIAGSYDGLYLHLNATDASVISSGYYGGDSAEYNGAGGAVDNTGAYMATSSNSAPITSGSYNGQLGDLVLVKFDLATADIVYAIPYGGSDSESTPDIIHAANNSIYMVVQTKSTDAPVTNGTSNGGDPEALYILKIDAATGAIQASSYIDISISQVKHFEVKDGLIHMLLVTEDGLYTTTDGSTLNGKEDVMYMQLDANTLSRNVAVLIGGETTDMPFKDNKVNTIVSGSKINIFGYTYSKEYPVTDNGTDYGFLHGGYDYFYTQLDLCPTVTFNDDVLSPASQTVCQNGLVSTITGTAISISSESLATIYLNGEASEQLPIVYRYQWQIADSPTGPWTDIAGAVGQNYTPAPVVADRYFRRIAYSLNMCTNNQSISSVSSLLVTGNVAPTVSAGGVYHTCPSNAITMTSSVSGGTPPYSYDWDQGADDIGNPTVAPAISTIYTVLVTDQNGCQNLDQALVNTYAADAGPPTIGSCSGEEHLRLRDCQELFTVGHLVLA